MPSLTAWLIIWLRIDDRNASQFDTSSSAHRELSNDQVHRANTPFCTAAHPLFSKESAYLSVGVVQQMLNIIKSLIIAIPSPFARGIKPQKGSDPR